MGEAIRLHGRDREQRRIGDAVRRARAGSSVTITIEGEAGIGKTELFTVACAGAVEEGFAVWSVKADEFERDRPFGNLQAMLEPHELEFRTVTAELSRITESSVGRGVLETPEQTFHVIDRVIDLAERQLSDTPLAILIDDAQWADEATLRTCSALSKRLRDRPLLLVVATRPITRSGELASLLNRIELDDRIVVTPLGDDDVVELVAERLGRPGSDELLSDIARCGGNAFFIVALLDAELRNQAASTTRDQVARGDLPVLVRTAVLRHLDDLGADVRNILDVAAVLGGAFSASLLADITELTIHALRPRLEVALAAKVLVDDGKRLRFQHDLVREIVYESVSSAVRRGLHLEIGRRMQTLDLPVTEIAEHFVRGAEPGDAAAADVLRRAANDVGRVSPQAATALLQRAVEILPDHHPRHRRCLVELAQWCIFANEIERSAAIAEHLLATTVPKELEIEVRKVRSQVFFLRGDARRAIDEFEVMLPLIAGEPREVVLLAHAAVSAMFAVELERSKELAERAVDRAAVHSESVGLTLALGLLSWLAAFVGDQDGAADRAESAVRTADAAPGLEAHRHIPLLFHAQVLLWTDRPGDARAALQRGQRISDQLGMGWDEPMYHALVADERTRAGEWDDALAETEAGLARAREVGAHAADCWLHVHRARIQLYRGNLDAATAALDQAAASLGHGSGQGADQLWHLRALQALMSGDTETADFIISTLWRRLGELGVRLRRHELAPDVIRIAQRHGDHDLVTAVLSSVERDAALWPTSLSRTAHFWSKALAHDDSDMAREAIFLLRQRDHAVDLARCEADHAAISARQPSASTDPPIGDAARSPFVRWRAHGLERLHTGDIEAAPAIDLGNEATSWDALTPSEQRVVDLVSRGLANSEIAEMLSISRRTVESHLYHVYPKLGLSTRVELAVHAAGRRRDP